MVSTWRAKAVTANQKACGIGRMWRADTRRDSEAHVQAALDWHLTFNPT